MAEDIQQDEVLVSAIDKGLGNRIHIRISRFKDRDYLDIRNYYEDDAGEWKPTRKGIAVPVEFYDEVMESLAAAKAVIDKRAKEAPAAEKEEPAAE
jgi:Transcriptional Coactivator p15 (PC4)